MDPRPLVLACEDAGIQVILRSRRSGLVETMSSPVEGYDILVPRKDLERARRILEERKQALEADPAGAAQAAEAEEAESEHPAQK